MNEPSPPPAPSRLPWILAGCAGGVLLLVCGGVALAVLAPALLVEASPVLPFLYAL